MFSAGSLGVIILMLLIKLASRFNPRKVIYGLVFTYLSVVFIFFKINSPVSLATTVMNFYPLIDKDKYLRELISPLIKFLPNNWLSETAYWLTNNNLSEAIPLIVLQIGCSILLFSIAVSIGKHWYFKTWLMNLKLTADNIALRKNSKSFFSFLNNSLFSPRTESIIKKDFWMFVREPSQWLHFLILLFMIMIFILSVAGIRYVGLGNFYLQTGIYLSVFLFNLLLISTISLRFVFPLISLEGESFWKLKSAPLDRYYIINKKLTSWGIIILLISTGLSYFSNHRFELQIELMAFVVNIIASITIAIINLGMGGLFANYKEKNAIRLSSSQGASITFLINIVYILFIVLLLFNPMSNYFLAIMLTRGFNMLSILYPLIPITFVSFLLIGVFIRAAYNSIQKDF
jgi:ABC-2 type transport system permease protein